MSRAMALKYAAADKLRKVQAADQRVKDAEDARKKWEWEHFEPIVVGQPMPGMTMDDYIRIIDDARRNHQNVYFGFGSGRAYQQQQAVTEPPLGETILAAFKDAFGLSKTPAQRAQMNAIRR